MAKPEQENPRHLRRPISKAEPFLVDKFLSEGDIETEERRGLGKELTRLKSEKYVPAPGTFALLEVLMGQAPLIGRVKIDNPSAWEKAYERFGSRSKLRQTFLEKIGFAEDKTLESITKVLAEFTNIKKRWPAYLKYFKTSECFQYNSPKQRLRLIGKWFYVVDWVNDQSTAYGWPFFAVCSYPTVAQLDPNLLFGIKERLRQEGAKPWRVVLLEPKLEEEQMRAQTLAIFLGR